jgi:hypothetical protein
MFRVAAFVPMAFTTSELSKISILTVLAVIGAWMGAFFECVWFYGAILVRPAMFWSLSG